MIGHESSQQRRNSLTEVSRVPLSRIDAVIAANLGPARIRGNAQPAALYRQIPMSWPTGCAGGAPLVRFLRIYRSGSGDYTCDRHRWLHAATIQEIMTEIARQDKPAAKGLADLSSQTPFRDKDIAQM